MHRIRTLLCALPLLPLLAACQYSAPQEASSQAQPTARLQGQMYLHDGQWLLQPCTDKRRFTVTEAGADFESAAMALIADGNTELFVDLTGTLGAASEGNDGTFRATQLYRVQAEGLGCNALNFNSSVLRANGNEPFWSVEVGTQGMVLDRIDQPLLVLPYLEEQLLEQRLSFSSQANGQHYELWITPQRCTDTMSGAVSHLSATLRIDHELQRGCAYYGGKRN